MDYKKIKDLTDKIKVNTAKLNTEEDYSKKEELRKKIKIDELKIKIERLK
ncbi:hypothetical protein EMGBS15_03850 [Filimonas sp.]|jgi:hypothetical protein|nr:hypothetical protein EMGBS15_03850 [Filimonas sp.]